MDSPRQGKPYFWVSWLTGLVSGEKSCAWAAWYRGHYQYAKRPEEHENTLLAWKADHAVGLKFEADHLVDAGCAVSVEDQNKFTYRGRTALVGAKPDVIGVRQDSDSAIVTDVKTGKERDSDVVQVAVYMLLAPHDIRWLAGLALSGEVAYYVRTDVGMALTRRRPVTMVDVDRLKPSIVQHVLTASGDLAPAKAPSPHECGRCDILHCPDRDMSERTYSEEPVEGAIF